MDNHQLRERPVRVQLSRKKDRSAYTKKWRASKQRPRAKCHPDRPHRARGLCDGCYGNWLYRNSERHSSTKKAAGKRWRSRNATSLKASSRRQKLMKLYGITEERYEQMLREQDGKCALCDRATLPLAVDHDHETGAVRGLLCLPCNGALAWVERLKRDSAWMRRANKYLAESN